MNKKILYTTIFGGYDKLVTPTLNNDWDFKCFSEENSIPLYSDDTRNAKNLKYYHIDICRIMNIVFSLTEICMWLEISMS